jgi:hypothetical protein
MGLAVLPAGEDRQAVPPADEPGGPRPPPGHHAGRPAARRSGLPRRRGAAESPVPVTLHARGDQASAGLRDWPGGVVGVEGPAEDLRDVPRRARAGVVGGDPGPFGRRDHLPPLRPPCAAGVQGDHDAVSTDGVPGPGEGQRQRMPLLPTKIRRCRLNRVIKPTPARSPVIASGFRDPLLIRDTRSSRHPSQADRRNTDAQARQATSYFPILFATVAVACQENRSWSTWEVER